MTKEESSFPSSSTRGKRERPSRPSTQERERKNGFTFEERGGKDKNVMMRERELLPTRQKENEYAVSKLFKGGEKACPSRARGKGKRALQEYWWGMRHRGWPILPLRKDKEKDDGAIP